MGQGLSQPVSSYHQGNAYRVNGGPIDYDRVQEIGNYIAQRPIDTLSLEKTSIGDTCAMEIAKILQQNLRIQHLILNNNSINDLGCYHLLLAARARKIEIDLTNNTVEYFAMPEFCSAFGDKLKISSSSSVPKEEDYQYLKTILPNANSCTEFRFEGHHLHRQTLWVLTVLIDQFKSLTKLILPKCNFGEHSTEALAVLLKMTGCVIEELDLSSNKINDEKIEELAPALKKINKVNFSNNTISDEGCYRLLYAGVQGQLNEINLKGNTGICYFAMIQVAQVLKRVCKIQLATDSKECSQLDYIQMQVSLLTIDTMSELNLHNSKVKEFWVHRQSIWILVIIVSKLDNLKKIDLSHCLIGDHSMEAIAELLEMQGCSIEEIDLTSNQFKKAGNQALARALEKNTSLKRLVLYGNHVEGLEDIEKYKRNHSKRKLEISLDEEQRQQSESARQIQHLQNFQTPL